MVGTEHGPNCPCCLASNTRPPPIRRRIMHGARSRAWNLGFSCRHPRLIVAKSLPVIDTTKLVRAPTHVQRSCAHDAITNIQL